MSERPKTRPSTHRLRSSLRHSSATSCTIGRATRSQPASARLPGAGASGRRIGPFLGLADPADNPGWERGKGPPAPFPGPSAPGSPLPPYLLRLWPERRPPQKRTEKGWAVAVASKKPPPGKSAPFGSSRSPQPSKGDEARKNRWKRERRKKRSGSKGKRGRETDPV